MKKIFLIVLLLDLTLGVLFPSKIFAQTPEIRFEKTVGLSQAVVDRPTVYDVAPSVIQEGDVVKVWYCGGGVRGTSFFGHDSVFYTSYNIRTGATITQPTRVVSPALNDTAEDGDHACAVSIIKHQHPAIADVGTGVMGAAQYIMYYECAPKVYHNDTGQPQGCYTQICNAASDDGIHWKKWGEDPTTGNWSYADDPTNPTPVVKISNTLQNNIQLQWQNGRRVAYYGTNPNSGCNDLNVNYGAGHPTVIALPPQSNGWQRIRLYYFDSQGSWPNRAMFYAESWDGFHFETPAQKTNMLSVQKPKYVTVPTLGYPGFYISALGTFNQNIYNYSWNGKDWFWGDARGAIGFPPNTSYWPAGESVSFYTDDLPKYLNIGKLANNCIIGTGNWIGDQYGRINSLQNIGFMSSDGKFGPYDKCTRENGCDCYGKEEDDEYCYDTNTYVPLTTYCANRGARGSTWGLFYLAGNFIPITPTPTPTPTPKPGDLNGDDAVNLLDYNKLVANFGHPYTIFDYNVLVGNWGETL